MSYNRIIAGTSDSGREFGIVDSYGTSPQKYVGLIKNEKRSIGANVKITLTDASGGQFSTNTLRDYNYRAAYCTVSNSTEYVSITVSDTSSRDTQLVNNTDYPMAIYQKDLLHTDVVLANVGAYGVRQEPQDMPKGKYVLRYYDNSNVSHEDTFEEVNANVRFYILRDINLKHDLAHTLDTTTTGATIVNNISNTTASYTYSNGTVTVTVNCDDGFMFTSAPTCALSDLTAVTMTLNSDGTTATGTGTTETAESELTITLSGETQTIPSGATIVNNIPNTTASYTYSNGTVTVTVNCADGYTFDGTPSCNLKSDDPLIDDVTFSLPVTGTTAQGKATTESYEDELTITITGATKEIPSSATIVNNISNTTASYTYSNGTVTVTVKCDDGFMFTSAPTCALSDLTAVTMTLNSDGTTATGTGTTETAEGELTITLSGETQTIPSATTVTNNITDGGNLKYTVTGTTVTGTVTGDNARRRYVNIHATYDGTDVALSDVSDDYLTLSFALYNVPVGSTVVLTGDYRGVCLTQNELTGAAMSGLKEYYLEGETVTLTATANNGTSFSETNPPVLEWYDIGSQVFSTDFTLSDDKKTATVTYSLPEQEALTSFTDIIVVGSTTPDTTVTGYGSINAYIVDDTALYQFAQARFKSSSTGETTYTYDSDLGEYVNKLHKIFCKTPETTPDTIKCGNFNTGIYALSLNDSHVTMNLGNVAIPSVNGNTTDLESDITVFVPFVGDVSLDAHLCGNSVTLTYDIDVVTGEGVYRLTANDTPLAMGECTVSSNVIYRTATTQDLNTIGSSKYESAYLMGLTPYVVFTYYTALTGNVNNDNSSVKIGDVTGFCTFDGVILTPVENMTASEQEHIIALLKQGVYIEQ